MSRVEPVSPNSNGTRLKLSLTTVYPWKGAVEIEVTPATPAEFTVNLRIPGCVPAVTVLVNGKLLNGSQTGQYLAIHRKWQAGDKITANTLGVPPALPGRQ